MSSWITVSLQLRVHVFSEGKAHWLEYHFKNSSGLPRSLIVFPDTMSSVFHYVIFYLILQKVFYTLLLYKVFGKDLAPKMLAHSPYKVKWGEDSLPALSVSQQFGEREREREREIHFTAFLLVSFVQLFPIVLVPEISLVKIVCLVIAIVLITSPLVT